MTLILKAFFLGFAITLGVELAIGFCFAIGEGLKGANKK